jgi:hypothetical protein
VRFRVSVENHLEWVCGQLIEANKESRASGIRHLLGSFAHLPGFSTSRFSEDDDAPVLEQLAPTQSRFEARASLSVAVESAVLWARVGRKLAKAAIKLYVPIGCAGYW